MSEPKKYASGQAPAPGDLCHFHGQPTNHIRVDALDTDGFVVVGFTSFDPANLVFVRASDPGAPPPAPAAVAQPLNGFAAVAAAAVAPAPPPAPPVVEALPPPIAALRKELLAAHEKLRPLTKDHVQGSGIARRLSDVIDVLDQVLVIFPELVAASVAAATKKKAGK